ncbi:unnamed protein product [Ostreobium quekettii]|uniref:Uncharacterized protein n=1 Tax=Ostreobium quekettii TaxID=121088 RepID=A0A8S1IZ93_9CHLO|nr:unnamed protein product [Ostreobium quekettii]
MMTPFVVRPYGHGDIVMRNFLWKGKCCFALYRKYWSEEDVANGTWLDDWERHKHDCVSEEFQGREDECVRLHFQNIQEIADRIHWPRVLPKIREAVYKAADVDSITQEVKKARSLRSSCSPVRQASVTKVEKELWMQLEIASFGRLIACCWLVPLHFLITRVFLSIIGRQMYLDCAVDSIHKSLSAPARQRNPVPPRFTNECQERALFCMTALPDLSLQELLPHMKSAVDENVKNIEFSELISGEAFLKLVSDMQQKMEEQLASHNWASAFETEYIETLEARVVHPAQWHPHSLQETKLIKDVINEVVEVVGSKRFAACLLDCVRCYTQCLANTVLEVMQGQTGNGQASGSSSPQAQSLPFVKCLSVANRISKKCLEKDTPKALVMGTLGVVHELCVDVYTSGVTPQQDRWP